ncbi:hypothetical protein DL770_007851 [Monosporascus sp. CRB-9-2]|nr:hypothetical protein DL770_007851 [Monosporascus sp. CRB-9-2]
MSAGNGSVGDPAHLDTHALTNPEKDYSINTKTEDGRSPDGAIREFKPETGDEPMDVRIVTGLVWQPLWVHFRSYPSSAKAYGTFNIKLYFIGCVLGFEAASALCGAAPTMDALIMGRAFLGVFGSGVYSGGLVFMAVMTTIKERPIYFSGIIAMWGLGSVLGPVVGGAFAQSSATWRWGFYINLPIGAFFAPAFLLSLPCFNPKDIPFAQKLQSMDMIGVVIFQIGAVCYTWPSASAASSSSSIALLRSHSGP